MMTLASGGVFALHYPDDPLTAAFDAVSRYAHDGRGVLVYHRSQLVVQSSGSRLCRDCA